MRARWNLNGLEFGGLALYACAFPIGVLLESQLHVQNAFLLALLNLPFLALLSPLLMLSEPLHLGRVPALALAWVIIFVQSYAAFVFLRRRAESAGVGIGLALRSSFGRVAVVALATFILGGVVLVLLIRVP